MECCHCLRLAVPSRSGTVGVGMAGASDTVVIDLDAHIIINTNAADEGMSDGIVVLDQNVNDDLEMGTRLARLARSIPRRAHARIPNTRNMIREHHHRYGHAHGREELMPHAVLASLPMPAAMPVGADSTNADPA
ncbi:hypothetical protein DFH11DRAFT_1647126 [Phellopilus nigrolimitatus]|nr:hypothetical protein DFH11DRAFT_1647126 [Phellopilus nigrolimitatus]